MKYVANSLLTTFIVVILFTASTAFAYTTVQYASYQCSGGAITGGGPVPGADANACIAFCAGLSAGCCTVKTTDVMGDVSYECTAKTGSTRAPQADTSIACFDGSETCTVRHWDAYVMNYAATPPTATLTPSSASIVSGASVTLTWSSANATACGGVNFNTASTTSGTASVSPTVTTSYSVRCISATSAVTATTTITVTAPQPDLTALTPALASGTLYTGSSLVFIATTTNGGSANATQHYSNRFQIDLNSDGSYDTNLDAASSTNTLAAGSSKEVVSPAWVATLGTHLIRLCTDIPPITVGVVPESNENNNCGATYSFTVVTNAAGNTYSTAENAVCSGGTMLGSTHAIDDIGSYLAPGAACIDYCSALSAACCTEYQYIFNDSANPEPLSFIRYTCSAYSDTATTPMAATYRSTPPPGGGYFREYIESWSATLITYSSALSSAITANATALTLGDSSLLTWSSTGATNCTGTGFAAGAGTSGSSLVAPIVTTDYFITCAASAGTWQYLTEHTTALSCPVSETTVRNTYSALPDCPSSPSGAACTGGVCKVNTVASCAIETDVYECRDGYGNTLASTTDSVRVDVTDVLTVSCEAVPSTATIDESVTWTSTVTGGVGGYTYLWTGSDGLGGSGAAYDDISLGYGQCAGGVLVGQSGEAEDIDVVPLNVPYLETACLALSTTGQCCQVVVTYPENAQMTIFDYRVYSGATVDTSFTESCLNNATCEYFAGIVTEETAPYGEATNQTISKSYSTTGQKTATLTVVSGDEEVTVSCDPVIVTEGTNTDLSAGTPSLYTGVNEVGNAVTFQGTITNVGDNTVSGSFQNRFQVDIDADGSYDLNLDVPSDAYTIGLSATATAVSPEWTNLPAGIHRIRFCSDIPPYPDGSITEVNEGNNCGSTMTLAVGQSLLDMSITASTERVVSGSQVTISWSAENADSCTVSGVGLSSSALIGSAQVTVTGERTYTITCTRGSLTDSRSVQVRLAPRYEEI